jgi:hypothetical protein
MSTYYTAEPSIPSNRVIRIDDLLESVKDQITANSGGPPADGAHPVYDATSSEIVWSATVSFGSEEGIPTKDGL